MWREDSQFWRESDIDIFGGKSIPLAIFGGKSISLAKFWREEGHFGGKD